MIVSSLAKGSGLKPRFQNSHKHLEARCSLLYQFCQKFGLNNKDIPLQLVVDVATKAISHQSREVRREAFKLFELIHKTIGQQKMVGYLQNVPKQ